MMRPSLPSVVAYLVLAGLHAEMRLELADLRQNSRTVGEIERPRA